MRRSSAPWATKVTTSALVRTSSKCIRGWPLCRKLLRPKAPRRSPWSARSSRCSIGVPSHAHVPFARAVPSRIRRPDGLLSRAESDGGSRRPFALLRGMFEIARNDEGEAGARQVEALAGELADGDHAKLVHI